MDSYLAGGGTAVARVDPRSELPQAGVSPLNVHLDHLRQRDIFICQKPIQMQF